MDELWGEELLITCIGDQIEKELGSTIDKNEEDLEKMFKKLTKYLPLLFQKTEFLAKNSYCLTVIKDNFKTVEAYKDQFRPYLYVDSIFSLNQHCQFFLEKFVSGKRAVPISYNVFLKYQKLTDNHSSYFVFQVEQQHDYSDELSPSKYGHYEFRDYSEFMEFSSSECYIVMVILKQQQQFDYCLALMNVKENLMFLKADDALDKLTRRNTNRKMISVRIQPILRPTPLKIEINSLNYVNQSNLMPFLLNPHKAAWLEEEEYFNLMKISSEEDQDNFRIHNKERIGIADIITSRQEDLFNDQQIIAIQQSIDYFKPITLIKGPPGTGKTFTSLGIISVILNFLKQTKSNKKIIATSHSNTIINDWVLKLANEKKDPKINSILWDIDKKQPLQFTFARLGNLQKCSKEVLKYSLEHQSQKEFFAKYLSEESIKKWEDFVKQYKIEEDIEEDEIQKEQIEKEVIEKEEIQKEEIEKEEIEKVEIENEQKTDEQIEEHKEKHNINQKNKKRKKNKNIENKKKKINYNNQKEEQKVNSKKKKQRKRNIPSFVQVKRLIDLLTDKILSFQILNESKEVKDEIYKLMDERAQLKALANNLKSLLEAKKTSIEYSKIQMRRLKDVQIIVCTLSTFDKYLFSLLYPTEKQLRQQQKNQQIDSTQKPEELKIDSMALCIIDEAPQCTETAILVPLRYPVEKLVLIGDPNQLGPVILDMDLQDQGYKYSRSLYERLLDNDIEHILLNQQFRAEQTLSKFTSKMFYEEKVMDGVPVKIPDHLKPLGFEQRNLLFIDIPDSNEEFVEQSYQNTAEAQFIQLSLQILLKTANVSVIAGYRSQVVLLQEMTKKIKTSHKLEIETVDAFQGKEQEVVIVDLVRTESIGFLRNQRRMNVALSRAKYANIIVGNQQNLRQDPKWKEILNYLNENNCIITLAINEIKLEVCAQIFSINNAKKN